MNDILKKKISIAFSIVCLTGAAVITIWTNFCGTGCTTEPIQMLCVNTTCNKTFEMTEKQFLDFADESGGMPLMEPPMFKCPKCNQISLRVATKCQQCKHIYIPDYKNPENDKCPKCGFARYLQYIDSNTPTDSNDSNTVNLK
jgi:hypothetical protein